jgi:hypothetical protein
MQSVGVIEKERWNTQKRDITKKRESDQTKEKSERLGEK